MPPGSVVQLKESELGCIPAQGSGPLGAVCGRGEARAHRAPRGAGGCRDSPVAGTEAQPGRVPPHALGEPRPPPAGLGTDRWLSQASSHRKRVEHIAKRKLESLIKESKMRDCEEPSDFSAPTLPPRGRPGGKAEGKTVSGAGPGAPVARRGPRACPCTPVHVCAHVHVCVQMHTNPCTPAHPHTELHGTHGFVTSRRGGEPGGGVLCACGWPP